MKLVSTRTPGLSATFLEAVQAGLAPDGGLFVPVETPRFADVPDLLKLDFPSRSAEILHRLLGDEFPRTVVEELARIQLMDGAPGQVAVPRKPQ